MSNIYCVKGDILYTKKFGTFETIYNGYILIKENKVKRVYEELPDEFSNIKVVDYSNLLIIPGLVDLHLHAPQFPNIGLGLDKELIPWLESYTFPEESKYNNLEYAKKVYSKLIKEIWKHGTTRCCVFATIHKESSKLLMDLFNKSGLGAYIGKVNMDYNSPDTLIENTNKSINDTVEIIEEYKDKYALVKPIITPRFVPSCSDKLLKSLGELAMKYNIPVQSHLSENVGEINMVADRYPSEPNYASVYNSSNLLGQTKTIMAHCVHLTEEEISLLAQQNVYVAHCPTSNVNLSSGIAPIRKLIENGIKVGLATDISGGHTLSMFQVMAYAMQMSNLKWIESNHKDLPLTTAEIFYLVTKGGGEFFGNVGSFEEGYDFDALVIDDSKDDNFNYLILEERLQKFIYNSDYRNIKVRYVNGNIVNEPNL